MSHSSWQIRARSVDFLCMTNRHSPNGARLRHAAYALCAVMSIATGASRGATIGVLSDGRQAEFLSLLGASSAATRLALVADGHQVISIASLAPAITSTVDVVWLPVLNVFPTYTAQERADLAAFVAGGGRVIFIGDADVFNTPDDSFLAAFGMSKLPGNLNAALTPALATHAVITGPHGAVTQVGRDAGYGLFTPSNQTKVIFSSASGGGAFAGLLDATSGFAGSGRLAIVCDSSIFGQLLDQDGHKAFLRNLVKWVASAPGYTPSGVNANTGDMAVSSGIASSIRVTLPDVSTTGETTVTHLGTGRCGFTDVAPSAVPLAFIGSGFRISTTAVFTGSPLVRVHYNAAELTAMGIANPSSLLLLWYDSSSQVLVNTNAVVDTTAQTVTATTPGLGRILLGALVGGFPDCNANGLPDACEPPVMLTVVADAPSGGTVTPQGATTHPVCASVSITVTPAAGHCFSGWTVTPASASPPAQPGQMQTTVVTEASKTVTANFRKVIAASPQPVAACLGATEEFSVQVHADDQASATYQWRKFGIDMPGRTDSTLNIAPVTLDDAATYDVVVTTNCGAFTSDAAALTVRTPPVITQQPTSKSVCRGAAVVLSVAATGSPTPTYQWRKDGTPITGAASSTYTIASADVANAGVYDVVLTNVCAGVVSDAVTVEVRLPVSINVQPVGSTVCQGQAAALAVTASGTPPLTYQWKRNNVDIAGATEPTYAIPSAAAAHSGTYTVVVTNSCTSATSQAATLTVKLPPTILVQPTDVAACLNTPASLSVAATGTPPLTYQWRKDGEEIAGATNAALPLAQVNAGSAGMYDVVVTNDCGVLTSAAAVVSVRAPTVIATHPASQTACPGVTVTMSVAATGANLSYQWRFNSGSGYVNLFDGGGVSGTTTPVLVMGPVAANRAGAYLCLVSGVCGSLSTSPAALTISNGACDCNGNGVPDADDIAAGAADCNNNLIPDSCEFASGGAQDCDANGVPDGCDIASGAQSDCDGNGVPDACGLASGAATDCDGNGVPDACDIAAGAADCNHNGVPDTCDPPYVADAGPDRVICVGQATPPLGGPVVASGSVPPYQYFWRIVSGPAGGGSIIDPTAQRARFAATQPGVYTVELRVSDFSSPPCTTIDTMNVTVDSVVVNAGPNASVCVGGGVSLLPFVAGGVAPYSYQWSIMPGSPSLSMQQFSGGANTATPVFTPTAGGHYVLKLTVTDFKSPPCEVFDTVTIRAVQLGVTMPQALYMPVGAESPVIAPIVSAPADSIVQYNWSIEPDSANMNVGQFVGSGANSATMRFRPTSVGDYQLRLTINDSVLANCTATGVMSLRAGAMTADAGAEQSVCVGGAVTLAPTITGGHGNRTFAWTIEPGSPSVDSHQFGASGPAVAAATITPAAQGVYTLRLTVRDSSTPPCIATDVVIVRAVSLIVDAGPDFVTQALRPSRLLGALPVAVGGTGPYQYKWRVFSGPSTGLAQFSDPFAARPTFSPSQVGPYSLELTVTDASGQQCTATDRVAIEAIADQLTLPINAQGKLFMNLRIDEPHRAGELRIVEGVSGRAVTGRLIDNGPAAAFPGAGAGLGRRLAITGDAVGTPLIATIVLNYAEAEAAAVSPAQLRIHRYVAASDRWLPAVTKYVGDTPYPINATRNDVGTGGIDPQKRCIWVVVDYLSEFAARVPQPSNSDAGPIGADPTTGGGPPVGTRVPPSIGGATPCGAGAVATPAACGLIFMFHRGRRKRGTTGD